MAEQKTFMDDFKRFFGRGLGILLPSVLTLWILWQLLLFLNNNIGEPINRAVRIAIIEIYPRTVDADRLPAWFRVTDAEVAEARARESIRRAPELPDDRLRTLLRREKLREIWREHWYLQGAGLVLAIVIVYFAGRFLGGYLGRRIYEALERFMARVPGFKQVYPHVKQLVQMVIGEKPMAFNRVVMVEYPSAGIWTIGLVTGPSLRSISRHAGVEVVTVFIPTTPTPFTGFAINVPISAVIDLPMSIEEALRFILTGGVLVPEHLANASRAGAETAGGVHAIPPSTPAQEIAAQASPARPPADAEANRTGRSDGAGGI
ncbi:MAG TPA: DUF502 domain-containing protein [Phycisphaerales bacterium]|nr:DUF502 domain-containing protein [Phycisphaerales bacterium]